MRKFKINICVNRISNKEIRKDLSHEQTFCIWVSHAVYTSKHHTPLPCQSCQAGREWQGGSERWLRHQHGPGSRFQNLLHVSSPQEWHSAQQGASAPETWGEIEVIISQGLEFIDWFEKFTVLYCACSIGNKCAYRISINWIYVKYEACDSCDRFS